jgi:hypothetical protein
MALISAVEQALDLQALSANAVALVTVELGGDDRTIRQSDPTDALELAPAAPPVSQLEILELANPGARQR